MPIAAVRHGGRILNTIGLAKSEIILYNIDALPMVNLPNAYFGF